MRSERVLKGLPELYQLDRWAELHDNRCRVAIMTEVASKYEVLPVYRFELGSEAPEAPTVIFVGGVHGVERIGTQVLLSFMQTLFERLQWDDTLDHLLADLRVVFIPLMNPVGMLRRRRSNAQGVDLMRNAPIDAQGKVSLLLGGHRVSRHLPWYRGRRGQPMQIENQAVFDYVQSILRTSKFVISLDCHSGFGHHDRIWFPYAYTADPFEHIGEMFALQQLFQRNHGSYSFYIVEPQSSSYTTHGDFWDYTFRENRDIRAGLYLPLTLEMGSWMWVRKNPRQMFNAMGIFNPVMPHRHERVLRRHQCLMDFLMRAARRHDQWLPSRETRDEWMHQAIEYWYRGPSLIN